MKTVFNAQFWGTCSEGYGVYPGNAESPRFVSPNLGVAIHKAMRRYGDEDFVDIVHMGTGDIILHLCKRSVVSPELKISLIHYDD